MKKLLIPTLILLSSLLYAEDETFLVVNKNLSESNISKLELSLIFLGKKPYWSNGQRIDMGYYAPKDDTSEHFFNTYIGKSYRSFRKYWLKRVFAGYGTAPRSFSSPEKALEFAAEHANAIVFISGSDIKKNPDIKLITVENTEK